VLVPERFRAQHPAHRRRFLEQPERRAMGAGRDLYAVRKNGSEFPVEIGLNPIRTDRGLFVLAAIVEITERKQSERRLRAFAADLQRSNQELDDFAYVASHDLKAPLRGIDNLAQWLDEDLGEKLSGDSKRHLTQLQQRVRRMEGLLDDLLQYSRAGRLHGEQSEVDTGALTRHLIELTSAPEGFQFEVAQTMPTLRTFKVPFEQVMRNLLSNAVKHHDRPDGRVTISANGRAHSGRSRWQTTGRALSRNTTNASSACSRRFVRVMKSRVQAWAWR